MIKEGMIALKKLLKKVSVLLALSMTMSLPVFAEDTRAILKADETELAINVLNELEITNCMENNASDIISRVDFAVYLGRMIGIDEYLGSEKTYYVDIPTNHYAINCVNYLTEIGAFSGYGDKRFDPEKAISVSEAVKVIFDMLGYRTYAQATGGVWSGYMGMADRTKLLDGFSGCTDLTYTEMCVLLYRAGFIPVAEMTLLANDKMKLSDDGEETLFERYWDITKEEGVIRAAGGVSLTDYENAGEKYIFINSKRYNAEDDNTDGLLGRYVTAIVRTEKDSEDCLVWATVSEKMNSEFSIDAWDFDKFENNTVYYLEEEKEKKYKVAPDANIIYNGSVAEYDINTIFGDFDKGSITLIDVTRDEIADTVIIDSYRTLTVGYVDIEKELIHNQFEKTDIIDLSKYEHKKFFTAEGVEISMDALVQGSVVSIKESYGKYIDVYSSGLSVEGAIENVREKDGRMYIKVNGGEYPVDKNYIKYGDWFESGNFNGRVGDILSFKLDIFDEVACITAASTQKKKVGYIIRMKEVIDSEIESVQIKLLEADGNINTYYLEDKVRIDGEVKRNSTEMYDALQLGDGRVIVYELSNDAKIRFIDTTNDTTSESKDALKPATGVNLGSTETVTNNYKGKRQWFKANRSYNGVIMASTSTVIFSVPESGVNIDDYYTVQNWSSYPDARYRKCFSYKFGDEGFYDDVIVEFRADGDISHNSPMLAVSNVTQELNSDDEVVHKIEGFNKGAPVSYQVDSYCFENSFTNAANSKTFKSAGDLEQGDIIQYVTDAEGRIAGIKLLVDYSDGIDTIPTFAKNANRGTNQKGYSGTINRMYALKKHTDGVELSYDKGSDSIWSINFSGGTMGITVIDTTETKNMVRKGTVQDIQAYNIHGENIGPIYMLSARFFPSEVIIYKK